MQMVFASMSPDGKYLLTGGGPESFEPQSTATIVWNVATGERVAQLATSLSSSGGIASWVPDGSSVVIAAKPYATAAGAVSVWDTSTWRGKDVDLNVHAHSAVFDLTGKYLAISSLLGHVATLDPRTYATGGAGGFFCDSASCFLQADLHRSPNGTLLRTRIGELNAYRFSRTQLTELYTLKFDDCPYSMGSGANISATGDRATFVVSGKRSKWAGVYDIQARKRIVTFSPLASDGMCPSWTPDGKSVLIRNGDDVWAYDAHTGKRTHILDGFGSVDFTGAPDLVWIGDALWNVHDWKKIREVSETRERGEFVSPTVEVFSDGRVSRNAHTAKTEAAAQIARWETSPFTNTQLSANKRFFLSGPVNNGTLGFVRVSDGKRGLLAIFLQDGKHTPVFVTEDGAFEGPESLVQCIDPTASKYVNKVDHAFRDYLGN